ncbi:MAG: hypothetical protein GY739_07795, partial [Mesoflavibacter sp.]|nr:hypothetical protein [Mesoflavibacter sp.]
DDPITVPGNNMYARSEATGDRIQAYALYAVERYVPFPDEPPEVNAWHEHLCRLTQRMTFRTAFDMQHIEKSNPRYKHLKEVAKAKYEGTGVQTRHEMLVNSVVDREAAVYIPYTKLAEKFQKGAQRHEEPFVQLSYRHVACNNRAIALATDKRIDVPDMRFRWECIIWPLGGQILLPKRDQARYAKFFYAAAKRELEGIGLVVHSDMTLNHMIQEQWVVPTCFGGFRNREHYMTSKQGLFLDPNTFYRRKQIRRQRQLKRLVREYKRPYR